MIWIFELFSSFYFGFQFTSFFVRNSFDIVFRFFIGVPIGCFTFAWFQFFISAFTPLTTFHGIISIVFFTAISMILSKYNKRFRLQSKIKWPVIQFITLFLSSVLLSLLVFFSQIFANKYCIGATYGDLPFHLNIISSFATGCNYNRSSFYDVKSSFFSGASLAYPFIPNFFASALVSTGSATVRCAVYFPSIFMMISLVFGIFALTYEFTEQLMPSLLSILLFMTLGGFGWTRLFTTKIFDTENYFKNAPDFVYEWPGGRNEYWFHPLIHVLLPQRASLYSMPLCYYTILFLILGITKEKVRFFTLAAILTGFMPLVQVHSYVAIAQWSIIFCILTFPYCNRKKWGKYILMWSVFGILANLLAFPQLIPYFGRLKEKKDQFLQINPIYGQKSPIKMWWNGLGVFAAISLVFGWIKLSKRQVIIYLPSVFVFLTSNIIRYQPWEMDNTKLFYAAWIPIALGVVSQYVYQFYKPISLLPIGMFLTLSLIISSFLGLLISILGIADLYSKNDWEFGNWINENTPVQSIFVTEPLHNHPVATIAGRQLFFGYAGWVCSHGLDYIQRQQLNSKIGREASSTRLASVNNISYIVSTNHHFPSFEAIESNQYWVKIYTDDTYQVWKINNV